jgi:hypothetical protein
MQRNFKMFILLLRILVVSAKFCQEEVRFRLEGHVETHGHNGSISHDNLEYPEGTYWQNGSDYYGCPCEIKYCLPLCGKGEYAILQIYVINIVISNTNILWRYMHVNQFYRFCGF